jgi:hypothetical protein
MYVVVLLDAVLDKKLVNSPGNTNLTQNSLNESYPPYEVEPQQIQELWEVSSKITFGVDATTEKGLLRQLQESMDDLKKQLGKA